MDWKDTGKTSTDNNEEYEEINYGRDYSSFGAGRSKGLLAKLFNRSEFPIIGIGVGLLILIIIFLVNMPEFKKPTTPEDYAEILNRIKQLEERFAKLESDRTNKKRSDQMAAAYNQMNKKINGLEQRIENGTRKMNAQLEDLKKKIAAVNVSGSPTSNTTAKEADKSKLRTHLVRSGETLYSISQRYGLSIKTLRNLNNLDPQKAIFPGQRLKISAE